MKVMTPEERFERIERSLEFLAASQAQHDARIAENSKLIAQNSGQIAQLTDLTLRIGRIVEEQASRLDDLGRKTDERIKALAESQIRTDEHVRHLADRMDAIINIVERYFSNGHH